MNILATIRGWFSKPAAPPPAEPARRGQPVRGRYDSAQTGPDNAQHWAAADNLSALGANSPSVRQTLRKRSRYEADNNGYCKGLLRTVRNDVVGTGPRLQLTLPTTFVDPDFGQTMTVPEGAARAVESAYRKWVRAAGVNRELRVMHESGDRDGECFGVFVNNPAINDAVKLALRPVEADQCSTPAMSTADHRQVDGIKFDEYGNPTEYHFLRAHPGDPLGAAWEYDAVPARYVAHWFDPSRPGQRRGVPATTPSLPLFGQVRRYTLATLGAAETAANIAGVLTTEATAAGGDPDPPDEMDQIPMPRNTLLTLAAGQKAEAFTPAQPVTSYGAFKVEVLTEAGAAMNVPRNVSTKSSAEYNYSSARLDHLPYRQGGRITREDWRDVLLDRLFTAWYLEARLVPDYLPAGLPPVSEWEWTWQWDGFESIDPVKDAQADDIGLKNGTRTLSAICAERGDDWEEHLRQRARELAAAAALEAEFGLKPGTLYPTAAAGKPAAPPAPDPTQEAADAEAQAAA